MPYTIVTDVADLDASGDQQYLWVDTDDRVHAIGPPVLDVRAYASEESVESRHPAALFRKGGRAVEVTDEQAQAVSDAIDPDDEATHYPVYTEVLGAD